MSLSGSRAALPRIRGQNVHRERGPVRIGILGTLDLRDEDGRTVEVAGRRLRALLIRLAIDAGRVVSAERLIEDVWADAPPANPANALQALVSRLRAAGGAGLVESHPGGYRLVADLDTAEFQRLVDAAR